MLLDFSDEFASLALVSELEQRLPYSLLFFVLFLDSILSLFLDLLQFKVPSDLA
jgi:hypothetical protein